MPTVVNSFGHTIFGNPGSFDYTQTFAEIDLIQLCADTIPLERLKQLYLIIHDENTRRRSAYTICGDLFLNIDIAQTRLLIRIIKSVLHNGNNNNDNKKQLKLQLYYFSAEIRFSIKFSTTEGSARVEVSPILET